MTTKIAKILVVSVVAVGLLVSGAYIVAANQHGEGRSFIDDLAEKLGKDPADVESAFDELKDEKRKKMEKRMEDDLDEAVKDGEITEEQKDTILEKKKEIMAKKDELRELCGDLKKWANENDVPLELLFPGHKGKGFGHGKGKGFGHGGRGFGHRQGPGGPGSQGAPSGTAQPI
ncbi:MAG: hypothetical protein ACE5E0_00735 [Terriglobia bacterium]